MWPAWTFAAERRAASVAPEEAVSPDCFTGELAGAGAFLREAPATAVDVGRDLVGGPVGEGRRNDALARLAGHLLRRYVDPIVVLHLLGAWNRQCCVPPLPDAEVRRTVDSVAGRELERRGGAA